MPSFGIEPHLALEVIHRLGLHPYDFLPAVEIARIDKDAPLALLANDIGDLLLRAGDEIKELRDKLEGSASAGPAPVSESETAGWSPGCPAETTGTPR